MSHRQGAAKPTPKRSHEGCAVPTTKEAGMTQTARRLIGAAKYTRYTMGSLSAVLFAACVGGS